MAEPTVHEKAVLLEELGDIYGVSPFPNPSARYNVRESKWINKQFEKLLTLVSPHVRTRDDATN